MLVNLIVIFSVVMSTTKLSRVWVKVCVGSIGVINAPIYVSADSPLTGSSGSGFDV